jgi:opacity protein-like surface antigen
MNRILALLALVLGAGSVGRAQQNIYILEYPIGIATGDLNDYIDNPSFRGFVFGYRNLVDPNRAVGLDIGWQTFFEKRDLATYTDGTASLTGVQYRYTNAFTASLQVDHVFADGKDIRPFVGIGAGTSYVRRTLDMGLYRLEKDPWQFMVQPEAGVSLYLANGNALLLSANYYWGAKTKELDAQSWLAMSIAFAFGD